MGKNRELLFSVTAKDCIMDTFCSGGPGGQNQNKRKTGVRFRHPPSGAVGESREQRSQEQNKRTAWRRMAESKQFRAWIRIQAAKISDKLDGRKPVETIVEESMEEKNLRVEVRDKNGKWVPYKSDDQE